MSATWIDILLVVAIGLKIESLVAQTQSSVGSTQAPTAFTKGQTTDVHVSNGEKIPYNKRITEIGASFDSEGSFVCQTPGLYAFTFYGLTAEDSSLWLEMMKNDALIASIFGHTKNDYADAGNAAIVHLNTGDKVYVKAHNNYNHALFGRTDQIYTTITGELLFADNIELDVENFYGPVGFSAILTKHASVSGGSAVLYDKTITNIGSGYNTTTGTFTVPVEGTYLFHFHALAHENTDFWLELFHNEHYVISSYGYTEGSYADAGNTAVLHLKKGDIVKTNSRPGRTARLYGASNELYTTFCGALLSPTVKKISGHGTQEEIAFSAGLTHHETSSESSKVVFDRVFLNHGLSFNANTGVFTAPVAGIYVFHYHALAQQDKAEWVELYHNYIYINSLYAHTSGEFGSGSNSAALELDVGDTVYLDIQHRGSYLYGSTDQIYCTFSGYLLSPISRHNPVVG